jgi:hypothetical protein
MATTKPPPGPTPSLPDASSLIDKHIAAVGGQTVLDGIKSCSVKGKFTTGNGATGTYVSQQVLPDRAYESLTTPRGERERGTRDGSGWEKTSLGASELLAGQAIDIQLSQPLLIDARFKREYSNLDVSGMEKIEGRDAYIVNATRHDGRRERLYFDVENGLLVRRLTFAATAIGVIPEQVDFSDYRDVNGIKLPFTVRIAAADSTNPSSTRTFEEVNLNAPIDQARFEKPAK